MREDKTYITPIKPSKNTVRIIKLKKDKQVQNVHRDLQRIQQLLLKVNDGIIDVQKTTYQYMITKKRNREYETDERKHKTQRKEDIQSSRDRQASLVNPTIPDYEEIYGEMDNDDDNLDNIDLC